MTNRKGYGNLQAALFWLGRLNLTIMGGGTFQVDSADDGLHANGDVMISGGTFIGTGASAMTQTFSHGTQGVITVRVGTQVAGTQIVLNDSDGNELLSQIPELDYEIVIFSAPEIQLGESYTLRVGDTTQTVKA